MNHLVTSMTSRFTMAIEASPFHFEVNCETTLVTIEINGLYDGRRRRNVNVMEVEFVVVLF